MTFISPLAMVFGAVAAAAVVALHLLATRRPPAVPLPTARFVPVAEARAVSRTSRPSDLLLLLMRVLAVLLIGAAFARSVFDAVGPSVRTVVMVEQSRLVADAEGALVRAREAVGEGGALVIFGADAREVPVAGADDSLFIVAAGERDVVGSLSAAFVVARDAAARIALGADSVRLVIVSPLTAGAVDAATPALRAAWPGRIELMREVVATDSAAGEPVRLVTSMTDDPLAPAVARLGVLRGAHRVRIVRAAPSAADSVWARASGRVLLSWPVADSGAMPAGVTAFHRDGEAVTVVAPFSRLSMGSDSDDAGARVIARWQDGAPAAMQRALGDGCLRAVAIGVPLAGDITLRPAFLRLLGALTAPCGGRLQAPLADSTIAWLTGDAGAPLAPAHLVVVNRRDSSSRFTAILLAIAFVLLLFEPLARRRAA